MSVRKYFKSKTDVELYHELNKCLRYTASAHNTDIISILLHLNDGKYNGIRELYTTLSQKYHYFSKIEEADVSSRDEAETLTLHIPVLVTGARPGDVLMGTRTQSKNAILKIYDAYIPPRKNDLDKIRSHKDLWSRFLKKINSIDFFANLTDYEKELYFDTVQTEYDTYFEDVKNLKVQILRVEGEFTSLDEHKINILGSGVIFPIRDVFEMFPKKPGSEGLKGRHTLIFRRGIWKITDVYKTSDAVSGPVIDLNGDVVSGYTVESEDLSALTVYTFDNFAKTYEKNKVSTTQTVGILSPIHSSKLTKKEIYGVIPTNSTTRKKIVTGFTNFTAASYKSLLQKIIRFRPEYVDLHEYGIHPSKDVLMVCIAELLLHPGSFVPDIQRYVSGTESALKRVVISLFEDAFIDPSDENVIATITTATYLVQRVTGWSPYESIIREVMNLSSKALKDPRAFVFDIPQGSKLAPYTITPDQKPLETTSALLEEIRSFQSDLAMVRNEVHNRYTSKEKITALTLRPKSMPLEHCVDQHWAPEIAYMFDTDVVYAHISPGNKPFSELFIKIFSEVTGVNPRRPPRKGRTMTPTDYSEDFEERPFVRIVRSAQKLVLMGRQLQSSDTLRFERLGTQYTFKYTLDRGWIAGMLGAVHVKGSPPALVTLHPEEPDVFVAVRKPSRNMKDPFLTDEREIQAINETKKNLIKGLPLNQTQPPVPSLKGAMLMYRETDKGDRFFIKMKNSTKTTPWNKFRKGSVELNIIKPQPLTVENFLRYSSFDDSMSIVENADEILMEVLSNTPIPDIRRSLVYLSTQSNSFEMPRIGREGGGTKGVVSMYDIGAYHLLAKISLIYPCALRRYPGNPLKFKVPVSPMLWYIYELVRHFVDGSTSDSDSQTSLWGDIHERRGRTMWDHQTSSVEEMKRAHANGRKGHFIWLTVGMGKSKIVLTYLKWLLDSGKLPKYVIYTLPSSAITSIREEVSVMGYRYKLLVPLKNLNKTYIDPKTNKPYEYVVQDCTPSPYHINLIEHDHLRRCENVLPQYASESIFVIDEVHKCLNETKRTSVALEISHLSREFIALTGTPVIDSNTYKLIWWLEQIVPFEVNEKNFWVAANGMVAKKVNTNVEISRKDISVEFTDSENKKFIKYTPAGIGGKNTNPRPEDIRKSMDISYEASNRGIIRQTIKSLSRKNGVFLVAKDTSHQTHLKNLLVEEGIRTKDIFLISKGQSLLLTDETVKRGVTPDYKIVITTIRHSEGYTLTRLNTMITGVYPSNNATREQLEGRINRIGQSSKTVWYYTVHAGILSYILQRHNDARNLSAVLSALAEDIKM